MGGDRALLHLLGGTDTASCGQDRRHVFELGRNWLHLSYPVMHWPGCRCLGGRETPAGSNGGREGGGDSGRTVLYHSVLGRQKQEVAHLGGSDGANCWLGYLNNIYCVRLSRCCAGLVFWCLCSLKGTDKAQVDWRKETTRGRCFWAGQIWPGEDLSSKGNH